MSVVVKWNRGLKANLPAIGVDGSWYFCEDTGELFSSVGTTLVQVSANLGVYATEAEVVAAVAVETTRAEAAEALLASSAALASETSRAQTVESILANAVTAETTRAESAESTLTSNLAGEVIRAEAAESSVIATAETFTTSFTTSAVSTEATARAAADATLATNLSAEVTRAEASEATKATSSALTAETTRAEAAESTLTTNLGAEVSRAESAESAAISTAESFATSAVSSEAIARAGADATLTTNLSAEVTRAETAEATKATSSALSTETSRAEAAETTLTSNLAAEATRAETAESAAITTSETFATAAVSSEATTRAAAVTTLQTNITNETTRAEGVEATKADLVGGVIPNSQIPPLAISMPFVVSSQTAMLALTAQTGDVAIRTDVNQNFILSANDPTTLANWIELLSPVAPVQSVAGKTGTVLLVEGDISNLVSDLGLKAPLASPVLTGTPTLPTAAALTNNTQAASTGYADAAVAVEKTRALAAESTNATAISTNSTAIATEASRAEAAEGLLAPKASPTFSGTVGGITAAMVGADASGVATAAVATEVTNRNTAIGVETSRAEAAEALLAPLASPALTGTPTAPTKAALTNNTDIATTAYADSAVGVEKTRALAAEALLVPQTTTVNGHALSANVTVSASDLTTGTLPHAQLPALLSGDIPANGANTSGTAANLSGTPTLPNGTLAATQAALDSSTKLGTTAYADAAVAVEVTNRNTAIAVETTRATGAEALLAPIASPSFTGAAALVNSTLATATVPQNSPVLSLKGQYWNGSASAADTWTLQSSLAAGTNGASTLTLAHTGSTGVQVNIPCNISQASGSFTGSGYIFAGATYALGINGRSRIYSPADGTLELTNTAATSFNTLQFFTDTGISRLAAGSLALGNGTVGDFSGSLKLTTLQLAASASAPTSAATAGTAGQMIYFGGIVYFCSVTGAAGSATWNKLNMTAV